MATAAASLDVIKMLQSPGEEKDFPRYRRDLILLADAKNILGQVSPEVFAEIHPDAELPAAVILGNAVHLPSATTAEKEKKRLAIELETTIREFKSTVLRSLPEHTKNKLDNEGGQFGLLTLSIRQVYTHLNSYYGTLLPSQITEFYAILDTAWIPHNETFDAFITKFIAAKIQLKNAGQVIPDQRLVAQLFQGMQQAAYMAPHIAAYRADPVTALASNQSMDSAVAMLRRAYEANRFAATSGTAGFAGAANASTADDIELIARRVASILSVNFLRGEHGAAAVHNTPSRGQKGPGRVKWCHSHGWGKHKSTECERPKPGHDITRKPDETPDGGMNTRRMQGATKTNK